MARGLGVVSRFTSAATCGFHGNGLLSTCLNWSSTSGTQMPLQSGSAAIAGSVFGGEVTAGRPHAVASTASTAIDSALASMTLATP